MTSLHDALRSAAHRGSPRDPYELFDHAQSAAAPIGDADLPGSRRHHGRLLLAIVAAIASTTIWYGATADRSDRQTLQVVADATEPGTASTQPYETTSTGTTSVITLVCGNGPPVAFDAPPGFVGPISGASPDSLEPVASGEWVQHWTSDEASIELRWPAKDGTVVQKRRTQYASPEATHGRGLVTFFPVQAASGPVTCSTAQLSTFASTTDEAGDALQKVLLLLDGK